MTKPRDNGAAGESGCEEDIQLTLLAYLHRHPRAADTLRGIVSRWLPQQRYESGCQRIEQALDALIAKGELRRDRLPDGEVLYALNSRTRPSQPH
ncbi:MAG: hypothetical protein KGJ32_02835 [Xanthomonadaceae bacterium]|nr:hypothetical protein [Xanthomonadaceae bacterium]